MKPRILRAETWACGVLVSLAVASVPWTVDAASPSVPPPASRKPNIILILADDLGYGDISCYGQQRIKTPNLDRMAAQGMRFTQAYAGATVCAPSRCALMTGLHVGHARIRGNMNALLPGAALHDEDETVAEVLKEAGYSTAIVGKWGLGETAKNTQGLPRRQGFDYFFGYLKHGHAHNYYTDYLWRNESKVTLPNVISTDPRHNGNVASKKVQYSHDLLADEGLKFVREHKDEPFFLYWAFTVPHANDEAGDEGMEVPDFGDYAELDWPEPQKGHAAMITRMDRDIGRMLELLNELGLDENTLVIFSSDNGPHQEGGNDPDFNDSNGALRGYKGNLTEGGIRVPFLARWPGRIKAGAASDATVYFPDIMPTFAILAGAKPPTDVDGVDFSSTLFGSEQPALSDRFMYWEWNKNGLRVQAARWRQWKAIRDPHAGSIELYDLSADIGETRNLAGSRPDVLVKFTDYFPTARRDSPNWPAAITGPLLNPAAAAGD
jgi:arylsulfatase A-like enzyme